MLMRKGASILAGLSKEEVKNPNNHSIVLRVDYGAGSLLFTGDLEDGAIDNMVDYYAGSDSLDVDVYQVGHHGSANGTTDKLVQAMSPKLAVISMGPYCRAGIDWTGGDWVGRRYGHPRTNVIEMLERGVKLEGRDDPNVHVATAPFRFESFPLTKKIYGTGWDGTIVLKVKKDGWVDLMETTGQDACPTP